MPLDEMFERYTPGKGKECSEAYRKIYRKTCVRGTRLYSGVNEVLSYLKTKAILAVATTKYSRDARILMEGLGIIGHFDFVLGADSVHKPKPEPDVILKILDLAGSRKDRAAFVGDTTYDILAGKAAGVTTIAVTYGFQKKDILAAENPDFLIDSLPEL